MNSYWIVSLCIPLDFRHNVREFSGKLVGDIQQQTDISITDADDAFGYRGLSWTFRSDEEAEHFRTKIYNYLEAQNIKLDPDAPDFSGILCSVDKYDC
jgi:hypothetical protein